METLKLKKLPVPVIYNSSGYESVDTLKSLDDFVDCYLPDFKYAQSDLAKRFSEAKDYPEICVQAITQMIEQTGENCYDENGVLQSGVIIRHLILSAHTKNSMDVLAVIKENFRKLKFSLMAQYTPRGRASLKKLIGLLPKESSKKLKNICLN